jgi:hypothetical protein
MLDDGQTESGAAELPAPRLVASIKAFKEPGEMFFRDTDAVVLDGNSDRIVIRPPLKDDCGVFPAVLYRVDDFSVHGKHWRQNRCESIQVSAVW